MATTKIMIDWENVGKRKAGTVKKQLIAVGFEMARECKIRMVAGSGRVYGQHVSSAPGAYPAVRLGRLRGSISVNWSDSGMKRGAVDGNARPDDGVGCSVNDPFTVTVGTNVEYAPYLEFGTSKMSARPFIRPTFELFRATINSILRWIPIKSVTTEDNTAPTLVSGI